MADFSFPVVLPTIITPAIEDALALGPGDAFRIADVFRRAGTVVPYDPPKERAFVLFWALLLSLRHGDNWRTFAEGELADMRKKAEEVASRASSSLKVT
jgi:hypothetical protein